MQAAVNPKPTHSVEGSGTEVRSAAPLAFSPVSRVPLLVTFVSLSRSATARWGSVWPSVLVATPLPRSCPPAYGNTSDSNEALTVGNAAQTLADYDLGCNAFDIRHTFNLSAICSVPCGRDRSHRASGVGGAILGDWDLGGIVNARSG